MDLERCRGLFRAVSRLGCDLLISSFAVRQPTNEGDFYRVSFGARQDTVLVLSRSKLTAIDLSVS